MIKRISNFVILAAMTAMMTSCVRIPVDTRSPIPVISVQSVGDFQYRRQS